MPISWTFTNVDTSSTFTDDVITAQATLGRRSYLSPYNGGTLVIRIRNNNDQASGFTLGDAIQVGVDGHADPNNYQTFWVDDIRFSNENNDFGNAQATLVCIDGVARLGRADVTDLTLPAYSTSAQFVDMMDEAFGTGTALAAGGSSTASAATYTGSVGGRTNQLIITEGGALRTTYTGQVVFVGRDQIYDTSYFAPLITFKRERSIGDDFIGYTSFEREQYGDNYANDITVRPSGLAEQHAPNVSALPTKSDQYTTLDENTTQALGLATFQRAIRSDLSKQRITLEWSDAPYPWVVAGGDPLYIFSGRWRNAFYSFYYVIWEQPDGNEYDDWLFLEGITITMTPSGNVYRMSLSSSAFFQYFTLDSTTLGVLDTSRLAW